MSSIGTTLRDARTRKSISLEEVHAKIKIHPRVLQLLEDEKFDKLPSPLFVKSFLKNYAEFLEVNPEEIMEAYEKEGKKNPEQILFIKPAEAQSSAVQLPSSFFAAGAVILILFFLGGAVFYAWRIFSHREVSHDRPSAASSAVKKTKEPASKEQTSVKKASEWIRSAQDANFPKIGKNTPLELRITALDNVWLHVTCDGKVLFQSILKRGASETWSASEKINIWTGNPVNMSLSVNQRSLGPLGKAAVKKMTLTRDGLKAT